MKKKRRKRKGAYRLVVEPGGGGRIGRVGGEGAVAAEARGHGAAAGRSAAAEAQADAAAAAAAKVDAQHSVVGQRVDRLAHLSSGLGGLVWFNVANKVERVAVDRNMEIVVENQK